MLFACKRLRRPDLVGATSATYNDAAQVHVLIGAFHFLMRQVRHVQIDVEGFDDVLLRQLPLTSPDADDPGASSPFARFRPASITFEHMLLQRPRLHAAAEWLQRRGYSTCVEGQNVVAFDLPGAASGA